MLNIDLIRRDPDLVRERLTRREEDSAVVDKVLALDEAWRQLVHEGDELRQQRNEASKDIGQMMRQDPAQAEGKKEEVRRLGDRLQQIEVESREREAALRTLMLNIPNLPADDVPIGVDESANVVLREEGERLKLDFTPLPHWDLTESLGIVDLERGAKLSGARFYVLLETGIRLQRALITWMLDLHRTQHGYKELGLPYMVRREVMEASGNLPKFADNLYHDDEDDLWLIPTAEVPITNFHRDEILDLDSLPLRYMAHTPCFRREKAAAGRDTRGIKRVHQFDKVEMYQFVTPEESSATLESIRGHAEDVCKGLGIPYRVLQLCTADMGFPSAKSYDLEMWAPGSEEWLEVSSSSNCTDFQARRANIRFRREQGARPEFVHTLNGSGLALPRVIIAILENFQQADGSVELPEVLWPYMGVQQLEPTTK
jgi:seryl-tRNA synthetase